MNRRIFVASGLACTGTSVLAGGHGRFGNFEGLNGHITTGTAELSDDGVQLSADFFFDGAPDPKIALGRDGSYDSSTLMGLLKGNTGAQSFDLPAGVNPADYNEVYIWCERFDVGLAVAPLN